MNITLKIITYSPKFPFNVDLRYLYRGCALGPFTSILENISNSALCLAAYSITSSSVPGSYNNHNKYSRLQVVLLYQPHPNVIVYSMYSLLSILLKILWDCMSIIMEGMST